LLKRSPKHPRPQVRPGHRRLFLLQRLRRERPRLRWRPGAFEILVEPNDAGGFNVYTSRPENTSSSCSTPSTRKPSASVSARPLPPAHLP
jgi:hypothetical protein